MSVRYSLTLSLALLVGLAPGRAAAQWFGQGQQPPAVQAEPLQVDPAALEVQLPMHLNALEAILHEWFEAYRDLYVAADDAGPDAFVYRDAFRLQRAASAVQVGQQAPDAEWIPPQDRVSRAESSARLLDPGRDGAPLEGVDPALTRALADLARLHAATMQGALARWWAQRDVRAAREDLGEDHDLAARPVALPDLSAAQDALGQFERDDLVARLASTYLRMAHSNALAARASLVQATRLAEESGDGQLVFRRQDRFLEAKDRAVRGVWQLVQLQGALASLAVILDAAGVAPGEAPGAKVWVGQGEIEALSFQRYVDELARLGKAAAQSQLVLLRGPEEAPAEFPVGALAPAGGRRHLGAALPAGEGACLAALRGALEGR